MVSTRDDDTVPPHGIPEKAHVETPSGLPTSDRHATETAAAGNYVGRPMKKHSYITASDTNASGETESRS